MRNRWDAFQDWMGNGDQARPAEYVLLGALIVVLVMAGAMLVVSQLGSL